MVFSHHWACDFLWYYLTSLSSFYGIISHHWAQLFMVFPHITDLTFYGILSSHITKLMTFYGIISHHWTHDFLWYSLTSLNSWLFMVFSHITKLITFYGIPSHHWTHDFLWYYLTSLNSWLFIHQNFSSTKHVYPTSSKTSTCFLCGQQLSHSHVQLHTQLLLAGSAVHCGRLHYILAPNITLEKATQVFFKNFLDCHT